MKKHQKKKNFIKLLDFETNNKFCNLNKYKTEKKSEKEQKKKYKIALY